MITVKGLIDDEDLLCFAVARETEDAVFGALVVAIAAGARFGGEG
jgi:hypothetical protein